MITQEVNTIALATAAEFVVGREVANKISELYQIIDKAMFAGYELGRLSGEQNLDDACNVAFDHGFMSGHAQNSDAERAEGYDEGYLDGVGDARAHPALADATVSDIINDMAQYAINGQFEQEYPADFEVATDGAAKHNAHNEGESFSYFFDDGGPYNEEMVRDSGDEQSHDPFRGQY